MKFNLKNKKILMLLLTVLSVIVLLLGGTYAWYVWTSSDDEKVVIDATLGTAFILFDGGSSVTGQNLKPAVDKENVIVKTITVQTEDDSVDNVSFNLYLDIVTLSDELKNETFKYELYEETTLVASGNFLDAETVECTTNSTEHIDLIKDKTINSTLITYTLYIWIDGTQDNDPNMAGKDFSFILHADGQNALIKEPEN